MSNSAETAPTPDLRKLKALLVVARGWEEQLSLRRREEWNQREKKTSPTPNWAFHGAHVGRLTACLARHHVKLESVGCEDVSTGTLIAKLCVAYVRAEKLALANGDLSTSWVCGLNLMELREFCL